MTRRTDQRHPDYMADAIEELLFTEPVVNTVSPTDVMGAGFEAEAAKKNIPGFVTKLYRMVNEGTSNLIQWGPDGSTFIVRNDQEFSRQVLPRFFKHNNFSSFVRQLNMYGFHKVPHIQQGGAVGPEAGTSSSLEFSNPNFCRNRFDLLVQVKRKAPKDEEAAERKTMATTVTGTITPAGKVAVENVLKEIQALRHQQDALQSDISTVQRENQMLWTETMAARERHLQQQQVIEKILRFLASIFVSEKNVNAAATAAGISRAKRQLLLEDANGSEASIFAPGQAATPANLNPASSQLRPGVTGATASAFSGMYDAPLNYDHSRIFDFIDTANDMGHNIDELQKRLDSGTLNEYMPPFKGTHQSSSSLLPTPKKRKSSPVSEDIFEHDFDISRFLIDDDENV